MGDASTLVAATLCSRSSGSRIQPTAFSRIGCATTPPMRDTATGISSASLPTRMSRPINFLIENGVQFIRAADRSGKSVDSSADVRDGRMARPQRSSSRPAAARNGSGLVRRLAESARKKGARDPSAAQDDQHHPRASLHRERFSESRRRTQARTLNIQARKGVIIATGGHTGNVNFRRMFDPRLTEEYQQACQPYVHQGADGENSPPWTSAHRCGRRPARPPKAGCGHHQDAPHRVPVGLQLAGLSDREPHVPSRTRDRPDALRIGRT